MNLSAILLTIATLLLLVNFSGFIYELLYGKSEGGLYPYFGGMLSAVIAITSLL